MKVIGWGWFHPGTPLDDDSRSIMAWRPGTRVKTREASDAPDLALQASACDRATVLHKPRELGDDAASEDAAGHISGAMADWLDDQHMDHGRGAPCHPRTHGTLDPGQDRAVAQTLKNRIVLEDDGLPGGPKHRIEALVDHCLVDHCNHQRHHEGLQILTLADVCFGRGNTILRRREGIKRKTIEARRLLHRNTAA